jgi:hypothetical protein
MNLNIYINTTTIMKCKTVSSPPKSPLLSHILLPPLTSGSHWSIIYNYFLCSPDTWALCRPGKYSTTEPYWDLQKWWNGVWTQSFTLAKQVALSLEPHLQSTFLWLFWWWGLMNYLIVVSNHYPLDLSLQLARVYRHEPLVACCFVFLRMSCKWNESVCMHYF